MAEPTYERLSAMDSSFLTFEGPNTHMHIGGTALFEAGPLTTATGGVDIERIRKYIGTRLHLVPRYRQRIAFVPLENRPVWIDDHHFNLDYHVRHTSLPRPGDEGQLKRLTGRIISQPLDRRRPLWEAWIVEGLQGGRFALISKVHHCMVDGVSGVDLLAALLKTDPDEGIEEPPRWIPRTAPGAMGLLTAELWRRAQAPFAVRDEIAHALRDLPAAGTRWRDNVSAVWQLLSAGLRLPADTPLNRPVGPHRRFEWTMVELADVKEVKNRLGGTVNDVVLTIVAGAVRRFLLQHRVNVQQLDYRAAVPVSVRSADDLGAMGNRVSAWLTPIPIQEADPLRRYTRVRDTTEKLKEAKQSRGAEVLEELAEWAGAGLLTLGVRLASWVHPYHLIVTNVPGPQMPLYMLGAPMQVGYPVVPLFENQGLGVAVFSYTGKLCWGINADWDMVPNLHDFVDDVHESFAELLAAARRKGRRRTPRKASSRRRARPRTARTVSPASAARGRAPVATPEVALASLSVSPSRADGDDRD